MIRARPQRCYHAVWREKRGASERNAAARRCLARLQPHERQPEYRLARDVATISMGMPTGRLDRKEISAWANYVPLSAVHNFGLSEPVCAHRRGCAN